MSGHLVILKASEARRARASERATHRPSVRPSVTRTHHALYGMSFVCRRTHVHAGKGGQTDGRSATPFVHPSVRPSIRPSLMPMAEQCSGQLAWPPAMTAAKTMLGAVAARRRRAGGGRAGDEVFHLTSAEEEEEEEEGEGSPGNHSTSHILSVSGDACMQDIYSCHSLQVCRACRLLRLRLSRRLQPFSLRPSSRCALLIAPVTRTHCARAHGSWRRGRPREMQTGAPRRAAPRRGGGER